MKSDTLIYLIILTLTLLGGISLASAHDANIAGHGFDIPDSYGVNETYENATYLDNGRNCSIFIRTGDQLDDENLKANCESLGFEFAGEANFTDNESGVKINQQNYTFENYSYEYYDFKVNDTHFLISFSYPSDGEVFDYENSPVKDIIASLEQG